MTDGREPASPRGAERSVVELLGRYEALTRAELARLAALPVSTVTGATARLLARGVIEEVPGSGHEPARGRGRPATPLRLVRRASLVGAVVVTHRVVRAALVSTDGRILGRVESSYDWLRCPDIVAETVRLLATAREKAAGSAPIGHVVLGLPVPYRQGAGFSPLEVASSVTRPADDLPISAWLFKDVAPDLTAAFAVPATVDNECNLAALGEVAFGAARGRRHVIYLKLVTGMGAGLVVNGELVHGGNGLAGELSHLHVDPAGPMCRCGARGCLGTVATADHILDAARPLLGADVSIYDVLGLAAQGDPGVRRVLDDLGRMVGRHLAPACVMLNPQMIVVDGTLGPAAAPVIDGLHDGLRRHMPAGAYQALTLTVGRLGGDAELLGAAQIARLLA
ncbi:ROK family transcriptional regulator [Actinoallomurus sp. NPDC052308]|uniref:ROK family transcriptional regulator n=1 Tax=Actinoallomurus sp. NPDC052308 TaxID=3155530 RepID=UPI0034151E4F